MIDLASGKEPFLIPAMEGQKRFGYNKVEDAQMFLDSLRAWGKIKKNVYLFYTEHMTDLDRSEDIIIWKFMRYERAQS